MSPAPPLLEVRGLRAGYGPVPVLHGVDLDVRAGEVVVLLGSNGAGKTTTLRAVCGMVPASGQVLLSGSPVTGLPPEELVRRGVSHVPQGRGTFSALSVEDNLRAGALTRRDRDVASDIERTYEQFPLLRARRQEAAGRLSGGEQQMLALGRALLARPRLLLLDEPSLGLAPLVVRELMARLSELVAATGTALLLVEQDASLGLDLADRGYVLEAGRVVLEGRPDELRTDARLRRAYVGQ